MLQINNQQKSILEILSIIAQYVQNHPERRFHQILWALGIIDRDAEGQITDRFYEESAQTLQKLKSFLSDDLK